MRLSPPGLRSFFGRLYRFLKRKAAERFGPAVESVHELSDNEFLKCFDIARASDPESGGHCEGLLLDCLAERIATDWLDVPDVLTDLRIDMSKMTPTEITERADRALSGDFHPSGIGPALLDNGLIDWAKNTAGSREWLLMIHRHAWWALWARAYQLTGDEKYAQAFAAQVSDWITQHPLPRQKGEHWEPWRLMEAGLRMRTTWIPAFGVFFRSPSFPTATKMLMLRSMYDHGRYLQQFCTNRNHLVRESNGLLAVGLFLSASIESRTWITTALDRLDKELLAQVNADGSHIEMSVGYQWLTIDEFEVTRSLLAGRSHRLPTADLEGLLARMYTYLAGVIRPDRTFPQINDGFILWGAERLASAASQGGWEDLEYIASGGNAGSSPDYCSVSFPNAGLHVMRSSWDDRARYLAFDTGPYGGPHGHEDVLSFELFADGAPFIVDPGSYTYQKNDPYRCYFVGSTGHNTMLVDQMSQVRRWNAAHMQPVVQDRAYGDWHSEKHIDFAAGHYAEGYAPFELQRPEGASIEMDVEHRRAIVFVKPDYWVLIDHVDAEQEHDYDFLFHLAPDVVVESLEAASAVCRSERNGARLHIRALSEFGIGGKKVVASEAPIQGWYSADHHKKVPAPTLIFRGSGLRSACVIWLLYPVAPNANATSSNAMSFNAKGDVDAGGGVSTVEAELVSPLDSDVLQARIRANAQTDVISIPRNPARGNARRHLHGEVSICRNGEKYWSLR